MKRLYLLIAMLLVIIVPYPAISQENIHPIVTIPFIGDTLDRVERGYFGLFPGIKGFQKAVWYFNSDSTFMVTVNTKYKDEFIDTTFISMYSILELRKRISDVLIEKIKNEKTEIQEIMTSDSVYKGIIVSCSNNKLTLIKDCCQEDDLSINGNQMRQINLSEIQSVKTKKTTFLTTLLSTGIGIISLSVTGLILAPEKIVQESRQRIIFDPSGHTYTEEYFTNKTVKDFKNIPIYAIGGAVVGYLIAQFIKVSVEYSMNDPDAEEMLKKKSLLPGGIGSI